MEKSPDAFRTISEVADVLGTPAHVLRFWESRFPQIRPVKRAGGRRYYRPSDVALLSGIRRLLHDEGLTIRGVQKILRDQGVRHVAGLLDDVADAPDAFDRIAPTLVEPAPAEVVDFVAHQRAASPVADAQLVASAPEFVEKPAKVEQLDLFGAPPAPAPKPEPVADVWLPTQLRRLPEDAFAPFEDKVLPLFIRLKTLRDALRDPARR